ncbi:MAG TPA: hypothetical protein VGV37_05975 [Aliidongia sp.]|uniref:hypothetical protein n=1 Tax=Aliidongia sp. TaxID=1914230 RepID=UPI002DDCE642|nr:hypothetical protein [Aliidongia sp.]HEV2674071.1 hypothetical protein [Aliidongia sp.]
MKSKESRIVSTTILAGLTAALLEFLPALIVQGARGASPLQLLQSIASSVEGRDAYAGGLASATLGGAMLLVISLVAAGVFVVASRRFPILIERYLSAGIAYGLLCYAVTNFVVIPFSTLTFSQTTVWSMIMGSMVIHLFSFGLPIAIVTRLSTLRMRWS